MKLRTGHAVLVIVGALGSAMLLGLAFLRVERVTAGLRIVPRFEIGAWAADLPSHLPWVVPFVALTATLAALRAIVWGRTLPPPPTGFRSRLHALALGNLVHNAAPGHLGVLASAWVLHRHSGTPLPAALSSLLLAKFLEFGALLGATALLALAARTRSVATAPVAGMLWGGLAALGVFTLFLGSARRLAPRVGAWLIGRRRWPRLAAAVGSVGIGLVAVDRPRRILAGWALGFAPVFAVTLAYGLALRHMGAEAYLLGGGLMVGALSLAQMMPGLPTAVGIYYFVCSTTARALGVDDRAAAALALLSHTASVATHILVGLIAALAHHDRLRELFRVRALAQPPALAPP